MPAITNWTNPKVQVLGITGTGQYAEIEVVKNFTVSVYGATTITWDFQLSYDQGITYIDVENFTDNAVRNGFVASPTFIRVDITAISGTANIEIRS